jgi:hypothetical protein
MFTFQFLQRHTWRKEKLQLSYCKIHPVVFATGGRRSHTTHSRRTKGWRGDTPYLQLEADFHPDEETSQFFVATKRSTPNTSTCSIIAERPGWTRWPLAIASPGDKESGASRIASNPSSPDDGTTQMGTKPPEQVENKSQPDFSARW